MWFVPLLRRAVATLATDTIPRVQGPKLTADGAGYGAAPEFQVTEQTEVLLDGKACRYQDVPQQATILRMEVAPDRKTVLRIHFRTGK